MSIVRILSAKLGYKFLAMLIALSAAVPHAGSAATWADSSKVLRVAFPSDMTGLDPAATQDLYSNGVQARIFDALYDWDYLERPYRFMPSVAAGMPEISSDGKTWTIRLRQGIFFADDPAFAKKKRELTAADFVYAWKRVADPRVRSPNADLLEGKLVGLDAAIAKAKATGSFDYDAEIAGLRAIDRHTLQIQLVEPDYTFLTQLNNTELSAVAREVIEKYADSGGRVMDHPVGTGPYRLKEWQRGRRVLLEANPGFRDERFPPAPATADAATKSMAAAMKGKRLPQIGVIDIAVVEETNPRLLMFKPVAVERRHEHGDLATKVRGGDGRLVPKCATRGIELKISTEVTVTFAYFNMDDSVFGGYTPERIALRRAVCSAYNIADEIRVLRNGQGMEATQPIPPDVAGHVPGFKGFATYDPAVAIALLDKFGYRDRDGDGYREMPDGTPLVLHMATETSPISRSYDELWQRSLKAVGIKSDLQVQKFSELLKAAHAGKLQFWTLAWTGDTAEDFMRLLHGANSGSANLARFRNSQFDALYIQSHRVPEGAERDKLYEKMTGILASYSPWCTNVFRISNTVAAPRIRGYKKNVHYLIPPWQYLDIELGTAAMRP